MGFMDGLGTLLGGFNVKRRIDEDGFDWREKQEHEQFLRDRAQAVAGQQDEDRAIGQVSDVLVGQGDDMNLDSARSLIPENVDEASRERAIAVALGQIPERKSSLEALKGYNRRALEGDRQVGRAELVGLRGDEAQELAQLNAKLEANMPITAAERERFAVLRERNAAMERLGNARITATNSRREDKLHWVNEYDPETNEMIRRPVSEAEAQAMARGEVEPPRRIGQTEQNRRAAARSSLELGGNIDKALQDTEFTNQIGMVMGRYNSLLAAAGEGDPHAQYLVGELKGLAALQPQIHGFRAVRFAEEIEKLLTTKQSPEALRAAIQGILSASYAVQGEERPPFDPSGLGGSGNEVEDLANALAGLSPEQLQQLLGGE